MEVFLIREACEVMYTLKDLPFRAISVSYPQVCRRQDQALQMLPEGVRAGQIPRAYLITGQHIGNAIVLM